MLLLLLYMSAAIELCSRPLAVVIQQSLPPPPPWNCLYACELASHDERRAATSIGIAAVGIGVAVSFRRWRLVVVLGSRL